MTKQDKAYWEDPETKELLAALNKVASDSLKGSQKAMKVFSQIEIGSRVKIKGCAGEMTVIVADSEDGVVSARHDKDCKYCGGTGMNSDYEGYGVKICSACVTSKTGSEIALIEVI